jgi:hypothetical protein
MKFRHLLYLTVCLTVLTTLGGCADEVPLPDASPQTGVLRIEAALQDFEGASTRTVDVDYSTRFVNGDEMGILALSGGKVVSGVDNICAVYDGEAWEPETNIKRSAGATYIAYSPYKSDLNTSTITSAADLLKQLSVPAQGTYSLQEYQAHDWLIADGATLVGDTLLKFSFTHAFPMLEIILPRTVYRMTQKSNGTSTLANYYIRQAQSYYISDGGFKMCEVAPNAFRCLVPPDTDVHVYGGYKDTEGLIHDYRYKLEANALKGGQCRSVVVDGQTVNDFRYAQGDFYLKDGSLLSKDTKLTDEQKAAVIGVVMYTNSSTASMGEGEQEALLGKGVGSHGYVLALQNVKDGSGKDMTKQWSPLIDIEGLTNGTGIDSYLTDDSGLNQTLAMQEASGNDSTYVAYAVSKYNRDVPAPALSTGWFLPSVGQWVHLLEKFANISMSAVSFTVHSWSQGLSYNYPLTSGNLTELNKRFAQLPAFESIYDSFWTSTELSSVQAIYVQLSSSAFDIYESHKGSSQKKIRCILAF